MKAKKELELAKGFHNPVLRNFAIAEATRRLEEGDKPSEIGPVSGELSKLIAVSFFVPVIVFLLQNIFGDAQFGGIPAMSIIWSVFALAAVYTLYKLWSAMDGLIAEASAKPHGQ